MPMSDYYRNLREHVGSGLLMMPSVAAVIRNAEDEILLIRKPGESFWGLPAGAIEPGELPARALRREVYEETGLMVNPDRIIGVYGGEKFRYTYANGDEVEYLAVVFECSMINRSLKGLDGEAEEVKFFKEEDFPELGIPFPPEIFKKDSGGTQALFDGRTTDEWNKKL
ncbi:NUDIX domain-containing protein [Paenibacillus albidus]|uniref:NUDIX domain-containing protein n=1 Tax=Paenibacillus albidus TaxID=2041023 RepID=UPI001BECB0BB|nr:NUDIX domain-containing protein [Paenibacillus albidus]MBT2291141.1 NUDIX domain-containing protein [Paenibacillus albidus]